MDFSALIKKSFQFSWQNKILWIFGFLSGGSGTVAYLDPTIFNYSFGGGDSPKIQEGGEKIAASVLGVTDRSFSSMPSETWLILALIIALIILILLLAGIFVTNWASASLVFSILQRNVEKPTFGSGARAGLKYWWKYYLLTLVFGAFIFTVLFLLALPVLVFFLAGFDALAIVMLILGVIVFILFIFAISLVGTLIITLAQRMIVHKGIGVLESLRLSGGLLKKHLGDSLLTYLVALGLGFAASFAFMIAMLPVGILLVVLVIAKFWPILVLVLIPTVIALFVAGGFWQTFTATYWTLFYEHLASKEGW